MPFSFFSLLLFVDAMLMGHFAYQRYLFKKKNPSNINNHYYFRATFFISIAFLFYSLPGLIRANNLIIAWGGAVGTVLTALGFTNIMCKPLRIWLKQWPFRFVRNFLYISIALIGLSLIFQFPASYMDNSGIIHWRFGTTTIILIITIQVLASLFDIIFLAGYFRHLTPPFFKRYLTNFLLLSASFVFSALGGIYIYIGDNAQFLTVAVIVLSLGILAASVSLRE